MLTTTTAAPSTFQLKMTTKLHKFHSALLSLSLIELNSSVNEFIIRCYTKLNFRKCWLLFNLRLDLSCVVVVFFICLPIGMSLIIVPRLESSRKKGNTNDFDRFFFISSCASIQCIFWILKKFVDIFTPLQYYLVVSWYQQCRCSLRANRRYFSALLSLQHCKNSWIACV